MRIAICDDDKKVSGIIKEYLYSWGDRNDHPVELDDFSSAEQFLFHYAPLINQYDLLFLDIKMDGMSGVDLAKLIRKNDNKLPIAFLTGSKEYALIGYDLDALYYLLKPVSRNDIFKCLDKVCSHNNEDDNPSLIIYSNRIMSKIAYTDIIYIESMAHYVFIHTTNADIKLKKGISELEDELSGEHFVRIQRSFIVNLKYIKELSRNTLTLDNNQVLSVSYNRWIDVNNSFMKYHMSIAQ
ncbi:MAG: LytR/AlgR family response regulator transcription factor [Suipraeoptans sp.]